MLGLAITSYRYIETPLRKGNWFGKRWKTLVVGSGVLISLSGVLIALERPLKRPLKGILYLGNKQSIDGEYRKLNKCNRKKFAIKS